MPLTVEDGTVVTGANSYVDTVAADTFFEDLGQTLWFETASDEAKEAALIQAASYMQQKWRMLWKGSRVDAFQSLDWPRRGVDVPDFFDPFFRQVNVPLAFRDTTFIAENYVPEEVKQAQMLLALSALSADGQSAGGLQGNLGRLTKREKVGSLEVEYMAPDAGGSSRQTTIYWDAQQLIQPYLRPAEPHTATLVRS